MTSMVVVVATAGKRIKLIPAICGDDRPPEEAGIE
jgi:hypothetical protein